MFWKVDAKATADDHEVGLDKVPFPALASKADGDRLWLETAWGDRGEEDVMQAHEAMAYYSQQIRGDGKNALLWRCRALLWFEKGEYDSAITDCTEAVRLAPDDPEQIILPAPGCGTKRGMMTTSSRT